jgi:DNA polymerase elongation subunit (family B)
MIDIYKDVQSIENIPPFVGFKEIPQLATVPAVCLDVETTGLDPTKDRILMIGFSINGQIKILYDEDEEKLLHRFMIMIGKLHAKYHFYLYGHNIFKFDLPFLIERCEKYGIESFSYRMRDGQKLVRTFPVGGTYPLIYEEIRVAGIDIIDTYMLTRLNDATYLFRDQTLKNVAIEIGFRKEHRLELSVEQIREAWDKKDYALIEQYLRFDLADTQALFYKFMPPYYYMQTFLPLTMQEIILSGNASKIESMLKTHYPGIWHKSQEKTIYAGAFTTCLPGFYTDIHKLDVSSQYPYIMLHYRLGPGRTKDPDGYFYSILKTLREMRLQYKAKGKTDPEAKAISEAMKIVINSAYGMLGADKHAYNNMTSASLVCEYGRKIVQKMMELLEKRGATIAEVDTDGVMYTGVDPKFLSEILKGLPLGIEVEHEWSARWAYIDGAKNYLISLDQNTILLKKGKFRKRNSIPIMIEFYVTFCEKFFKSKPAAEAYYKDLVRQFFTRTIDVKKVTVHRKIGKAEKSCLAYGRPGDTIDVYYGSDSRGKPVPVISGPYHSDYYIKKLTEWHDSILGIDNTATEEIGIEPMMLDAFKTKTNN